MRIVFQLTPGTEAPAEMNFYFPDRRALCMAENATHNLHNLLTLRGALVRDPHVWAATSTEAIELLRRPTPTSLFASHHWPTWGTRADRRVPRRAARPLRLPARPDPAAAQPGLHRHRDRRGLIELPPGLDRRVAHPRLLRLGQPQRQGDLPALPGLVRRQPGPPVGAPAGEQARALRRVHGRRRRGARARRARVLRRRRLPLGRRAAQPRRLRRPGQRRGARAAGRRARAARLRRRERHLAQLLPDGRRRSCARASPAPRPRPRRRTSSPRSPSSQLFDAIAIRVDGPRAWDQQLRIDWVVTDPDEAHAITVRNGVLSHRPGSHDDDADATLVVERAALDQLLLKTADIWPELAESGRLRVEGDGGEARRAARPARRARPGLRDRHPA